ncbi:MAG TPA: TIGR01777 family oxidoreductase [Gemmataceae bacterium]|nr:TIGR01777 family oxidoreductase [Gemmataceae bacterium]
MKIFVLGGTGLIGGALVSSLTSRADEVVLLTRRPAHARERWGNQCTIVEGDPVKSGPWMEAVKDCDAVINLVGESIFARRWNEEFKALLRESRINSTQNVVRALMQSPKASTTGKPKVLVNGSAIGFYGPCGDEELTEEALAGSDMLAQLALEWEQAASLAETAGIRVARIRTGVVLDKEGGALPQMLTPFKLGLGGPIGSGKHWFSWIHIKDEIGIILLALDHPGAVGAINATASHPVTNKAFSKALGRALQRPAILPVPPFMLRVLLGQVAEILTTGQRVIPAKALALGYQFKFPEIDPALRDLLG